MFAVFSFIFYELRNNTVVVSFKLEEFRSMLMMPAIANRIYLTFSGIFVVWRVVVLMIVTLELEQRMTMVVDGQCK